jgi:hypothetical protein
MSKLYRVKASSMTATYTVGTFVADSPEEACEKGREDYRRSDVGRSLRDVGAFRFYANEARLADEDE